MTHLAARVPTLRAFEASAECRFGWTCPVEPIDGVKIEVVERIYENLRLRFVCSGLSVGQARLRIRAVVDAPAFRRQCEVGRLKSVGVGR